MPASPAPQQLPAVAEPLGVAHGASASDVLLGHDGKERVVGAHERLAEPPVRRWPVPFGLMGELGDALELMQQAWSSFRSFRADIRHWLDPTLWLEASLAFKARGGIVPAMPLDPVEPQEVLTRCWIQQPGRLRVERTLTLGTEDYRASPSLLVVDGERWWAERPEGAFAGEVGPDSWVNTGIEFGHLFDPREVVAGLDLEVVGRSAVAGREGIRLRGARAPMQTSFSYLFDNFTRAASGYELVVDAERGILLRMIAFFGARKFDVKDILDVGFDEDLKPALFVFASQGGAAPRAQPEPRPLTLDDCRTYPGFTVLVPSLALSTGEGFLEHISERVQWAHDEAPHVFMRYYADDGQHHIDFDQSRASDERLAEHGVEEPGGSATNFLMWTDEPPDWHEIEGVMAGTFVHITSNFDVDTLTRFVQSLVPVDRALP